MRRFRVAVFAVPALALVFGGPVIGAAKKAVRPAKKPVHARRSLESKPLKPAATDPATQHYLAGEKAYKAADYATAIVEWQVVRNLKPSEHIERAIYLATDALVKQEESRRGQGTSKSSVIPYDSEVGFGQVSAGQMARMPEPGPRTPKQTKTTETRIQPRPLTKLAKRSRSPKPEGRWITPASPPEGERVIMVGGRSRIGLQGPISLPGLQFPTVLGWTTSDGQYWGGWTGPGRQEGRGPRKSQ